MLFIIIFACDNLKNEKFYTLLFKQYGSNMSKEKKRILFFYSDMGDGGTQKVISLLSDLLCKEFDLYLALYADIQIFPFNGKIILLRAPSVKNKFILLKNILLRIIRLNKVIKDNEIDIVFSRSLIANMSALLTKRIYKFKAPLVISFHSNLTRMVREKGVTGKIAGYVNKKYAKYAEGILGVSKGVVSELEEYSYPRNKLKYIYNPLAVKEVAARKNELLTKSEAKIFKEKPVVLSVGRFVTAKNYPLLVQAFYKTRQKIDCRLVILGDGDKKQEISTLCQELGIQDDVYLPGWVKNPYKYMKNSALYVLSSLWEGFPNVLIEAMACSCPVVATDCPHGPSEIIQNGESGIIVPNDDVEKLAEAMIDLLFNKNKAAKMRKNALKRAAEFSKEKIADNYIAYVYSVIDKGNS